MTAIPDFPEEVPTPQPWQDDELSVRQALRALGTHVLDAMAEQERRVNARIDAMSSGLRLELSGIHNALEDLKDRSSDTGRHIIQIATEAGEAKGMAQAVRVERRTDSDPVRAIAVNVFTLAAKHWPAWVWRLLPLVTAGVMYVLHRMGALGR